MKKITCSIFIFTMLFIYMALLGFYAVKGHEVSLPNVVDEQIVSVQDGELISGGQHRKISLPDHFDVKGETRLEFMLNYEFSGKTVPSLIVQANHSFMTILLNDEVIYSVEPQPYSLGNYFTNIPLPQKAKDAELEIRVTLPPTGLTRVSMPDLIIADEGVFIKEHVLNDISTILLNTLILFSGLILLVLGLMAPKSIDSYKMLVRGFFALSCGLYFMCETYSVVYISSASMMIYLLDMLSFAMLGPILLALLGWDLKDWRGKLLNFIAGFGMLAVIVQLGAWLIGGVELRRLLPLTHVVQIVGILGVILCLIYGLIAKKSNKGLYLGGIIALCGAVDLVLFMCEIGENNVFFLRIGILVYLFLQMYYFIRLLMAHSAKDARESYYKTLAMQDPLSQCYSRAAFELDKSAWKGDDVRTVFFLDLNNLKATNDLLGHSAGDRLIHGFGSVLNQVFFSVGKCYRVGGDEFWVFCDGLLPGRAEEMVQTTQRGIDLYNSGSNLPTKLSYAIGVCDTKETGGNLNRAIEIADMRMYENKRFMRQHLDIERGE